MKKFAAIFMVAFLFILGFSSAQGSCNGKVKVGILYEYGGMEQDFNALVYDGAERVKQEYPSQVDIMVFNPGIHTTAREGLNSLIKNGCDLIFSVGGSLTEVTTETARKNPQVKFAVIDEKVPGLTSSDNLVCLTFREQEASYLVGMAAALKSKTNTIGFIGAMDIPVINRFEAGYVAGAKKENPKIRVLRDYIGETSVAYKNFYQARELARTQIQGGADVLYHAASFAGLGVIEAAAASGKLAIGADVDQSYTVAEKQRPHVLTSMIKHVDRLVYRTVEATLKGEFRGGYVDVGLKEGAVDYAVNAENREMLADIQQKLDQAKADIINGKIVVPETKS